MAVVAVVAVVAAVVAAAVVAVHSDARTPVNLFFLLLI